MRGGAGNDIYAVNVAGEARELAGQGVDFVRSFVDYALGANLEILELIVRNRNRRAGSGRWAVKPRRPFCTALGPPESGA